MSGPVTIAREAWGDQAPDWIIRLAEECEATSQNKVAGRLGRSGAMISQVLRRKYPADLSGFEDLVRGVLMSAKVECPALGPLPTQACQAWQRRALVFEGHNALRVKMYRACRRCPRFRRNRP